MLGELLGERVVEENHGGVHLRQDVDQGLRGEPHSILDRGRLPQSRRLELGNDPLDQVGVVASATAVQQGDHTAAVQSLRRRWGRHGSQDRQSGLVVQVGKCLQRLGIELQQQRAQSAGRLVHRPDRLLVLAGQSFDRQGLVAHGGKRTMLMPTRAEDVGQHRGVAVIGLLASLVVAFAVAGDGSGVDRVDGARCPQREHQQVLVGLQGDGRLGRGPAVFGDQGDEFGVTVDADVDPLAVQHPQSLDCWAPPLQVRYWIALPPSTFRECPVTKADLSEAR